MKIKNLFNFLTQTPEADKIRRKSGFSELLKGGGGVATDSGQSVTPQSAMRQITVYNCIRVLSESAGMLPCKLYRKDGNKTELADDHPLARALSIAPNEYMTAQELWELVIVHLCLRGNFYAHKVQSKISRRMELHPLAPENVTPKMDERRRLFYEVDNGKGEKQTLTQKEIWHVRLASIDGINGLSPISQGAGTLGLNQAILQYSSKFFVNGARPTGIVTISTTHLEDDAMDKLQDQFNGRYAGSTNAGKVLFFLQGMEWQSLSLSAHDAQLIESQKLTEAQICGLFRVPPHLIANMEKMTLNNIEHMGMSFVNYALVPYLTRIEKRILVGLLDESEQSHYYAKFNTAALMRGDLKSRYEAYATGIQWGIVNANECRANEELNPREGGDDYLTPLNMSNGKKPTGDNDEQPDELPA